MTLPLRLASWATDTISGFLDALLPANHLEPCTNCGVTTRAGVQPCTLCMYAAADELADVEAEVDSLEPGELSWGVDGATTVPAGVEVAPQPPPAGHPYTEVFAPAESDVLAALIAGVLAEHNPFEGAGGIECAPAWADFETPYSVDHMVHLSGMAAWREHVSGLIAARIKKATADALSAAEFPQHTKK